MFLLGVSEHSAPCKGSAYLSLSNCCMLSLFDCTIWRVRGCDQIIPPSRNHVQRVTQQCKWPMEWICGYMVKLTTFHTVSCKSSLLELPIKVLAAVFEDVPQRDVFIRILKVIEYAMSERHVNHISKPVQIRGRANEGAPRSKYFSETSQYKVARNRQVLDDFREKHEVILPLKRRFRCA